MNRTAAAVRATSTAATTSRAVLRRVMEQMRADASVLQGVVDAARAGSPPVGALPEHEVKRHVAALLAVASSAFIDRGGLADEHARTASRLAADRAAQGVPLSALLDGFLAGRTQVFRTIAERLRVADVPSTVLLDALVELDTYAGELQNRLIAAYRETEQTLAGTSRTARLEALREVLVHGAVDRLAAAGLEADRSYRCLLADVGDPLLARRTEAELSAAGGMSGLVEGRLCVVAARLTPAPAAAGELAVVSPPVPTRRLPVVYGLCRAALDAARRRGLGGTRQLTGLAAAVAEDGAPGMGPLLAGELLHGLVPGDAFHRLIAETALVYLDRGSRADLTAEALHVHPNTVKHRLRRLAELTPFGEPPPPDDVLGHAFRWRWALHSWLDDPAPAHP